MSAQVPRIYSIYETAKLMHIFAETPYYPGGEREVGIIDLTVQRDPVSELPIQRGTGIKGALRSYYELSGGANINIIFGNSPGEATARAGCVSFLDARILLFPVRASFDLYIYLTSLEELIRYAERLSETNEKSEEISKFIKTVREAQEKLATINKGEAASVIPADRLILLDGQFEIKIKRELQDLVKDLADKLVKFVFIDTVFMGYVKEKVKRTLTIVNQETFSRIVNRGLERVVRVRLQYETKTVKRGGMFIQELIPAGTLMYSAVMVAKRCTMDEGTNKAINEFLGKLKEGLKLNLGGDETVGRGIVMLYLKP